jgi:hypothetical protein
MYHPTKLGHLIRHRRSSGSARMEPENTSAVDPPTEPLQQQQHDGTTPEEPPVAVETSVPVSEESATDASPAAQTAQSSEKNNETPSPQFVQTWNIFVGDLQPTTTEQHLRDAFSPCGPIHAVYVRRDKYSGLSKGMFN